MAKWRIRSNETKSTHVTFTTRSETCPPVKLNGLIIPQNVEIKYLGLYLDRRLTWKKHIFAKRKQLGLQLRKIYWLIGRKSKMSLKNKLLLYKSIIKPIWSYGIQLWRTASNSNIEILQRFQSKILRIIVNAPWYVSNETLHNDLRICTVKEEIRKTIVKHKDRLQDHPNSLVTSLMTRPAYVRRLRRKIPQDLTVWCKVRVWHWTHRSKTNTNIITQPHK